MTVVEIDAVYVKPFTTNTLIITPGQTTNVLLSADSSPGRYFIGARAFMDAPIAVDNKTAMAILQYKGVPNTTIPITPKLPVRNDTELVTSYNKKLRSLNSAEFPANVPLTVDRKLFYTIGLGQNACPTCLNGTKLTASLNNISFVMPKIGLLQAHYYNIKGVFRTDFPDRPPKAFNYTGVPLTANLRTTMGTRLSRWHSIRRWSWCCRTPTC
ncbi:Laccase-11 [Acorus calamus]|uniref:Laccase-11 n=1 Tax=Acorus calamus TaxID=4465 RepID=A0AAV9DK46_ACOCL|nr:Laccase-11 [Acorus calamus]